jgi:hypothetical protein
LWHAPSPAATLASLPAIDTHSWLPSSGLSGLKRATILHAEQAAHLMCGKCHGMQWIVEQCLHAAGQEHLGRVVCTASPPVFPMSMTMLTDRNYHQRTAVLWQVTVVSVGGMDGCRKPMHFLRSHVKLLSDA